VGLTEAGEIQAKWTTEIYFRGFRILLTQPFENAAAIVGLMDRLASLGFTPTPVFDAASLPVAETENKEANQETEPPICPTHNKAMVQRSGQYGKFWSCPTRLPDGNYCKYRPPKKPN